MRDVVVIRYLYPVCVSDDIEWPNEEEFQVLPEARDLITQLLQQTPLERLGTGGAQEVKVSTDSWRPGGQGQYRQLATDPGRLGTGGAQEVKVSTDSW